jgi:hypothetical protein
MNYINKNNNLLAIGIPTYKRPEFAIKLIKKIIDANIYDQIIICSNSFEPTLSSYIESIDTKNIVFFQQNENVGLAKNYFKLIELCSCNYLHVVSDEDAPNKENTKLLYERLSKSSPVSIIVATVNDINGKVYKDATWQKNNYLKDLLGETAHIGSNVINVNMIGDNELSLLKEYCDRAGSVYIGPAAALLSYSAGQSILYFPSPLVEMGVLHDVREISGHFIYGMPARILQYISLYLLLKEIKFKRRYRVALGCLYYFSSHALQDAKNKFNEKPSIALSKYFKEYRNNTFDIKLVLFLLFSSYYFFRIYFQSRIRLSRIIKDYRG